MFVLLASVHYFLIRIIASQVTAAAAKAAADAAKHETLTDCIAIAMNAFSPFFERFSSRGLSGVPFVSSLPSSLKDDCIIITWCSASLLVLYRCSKRMFDKARATASLYDRAAAVCAMVLAVGGLLPWLSPNSFSFLEHQFPRFFRAPPHALAAVLPWALWVYFVFLQLLQPHAMRSVTRQDVYAFLDGVTQYSYLLGTRLIQTLCWAILCSLLFAWAYLADLNHREIVDFHWRVDSSQLLVNASAVWPIPYAVFHRFPHPSVLAAEASSVSNQQSAHNRTPFVCSINIHQ